MLKPTIEAGQRWNPTEERIRIRNRNEPEEWYITITKVRERPFPYDSQSADFTFSHDGSINTDIGQGIIHKYYNIHRMTPEDPEVDTDY
jgi:hypothetical protein